jgi:chromosome segregation ATPase
MQLLATTHKASIDELSTRQRLEAKLRTEYDACRSLCTQYQSESIQFAERCRALEDSNTQLITDANKLRSQLLSTKKLTEEQATDIVELEKRLIHSDELLKTAKQNQTQLEQQLHDARVTTEKYQMSMQGQLDAYAKQASLQENQIHALESANCLLKDELTSVKNDNKFLLTMTKQDKMVVKELQQRLDELTEEHQLEIEQVNI